MSMGKFEIVFIEGIEEDFAKYGITAEHVIKIQNKISFMAGKGINLGELLKGLPYKIRKVRFGDHRLFIHVKSLTVYCLAFIHRRECYKRENLSKLVSLAKNIH